MATVQGKVKGPAGATFAGHRATLLFHRRLSDNGNLPAPPASVSAATATDGVFSLALPGFDEVVEPIQIVLAGPSGVELARQPLAATELDRPVVVKARPEPAFPIRPSDDPTLGQRVRLQGRVIDERGRVVPAGLPVVIWGVAAGGDGNGAEPPATALVVTTTQTGGYFAGAWPPAELAEAYGTVKGGAALPIHLTDDRLPTRVVLVTTLDDEVFDDPCSCDDVPPTAPEPADLAANPAAFSQDLGGGCVDLTVPNRVLEEFAYFLAVRTSEPEIKGLTLDEPVPVPAGVSATLAQAIEGIAGFQTRASIALGPGPTTGTIPTGSGTIPTDTGGTIPTGGGTIPPGGSIPAGEPNPGATLTLDAATVRSLVRTDAAPTLAELESATFDAEVAQVRRLIDTYLRPAPGRTDLDASHAVDWDDSPTVYQATTVSHGHLLQFREVYRANGCSLGDLVHSLPLAPGQKRQIAVLDWDRRTSSSRTEALDSEERLDSFLERDREVLEIVGSQLSEETSGSSRSTTWGAAGGIGAGFIGTGFGIFGGVAGGGGGSSAEARQDSSRTLAANSLQQLSDRVTQRASAVRDTRSTVVQTVAQGESVRAETETIVNYNHCHALTIEYFEVLRHFLVSHELVDVRECLFIPLPMRQFDQAKALRWQEPLRRFLRKRELAGGFAAMERIARNWDGYDFPESRFSEEAPLVLEGELRISFLLPRPRDAVDGAFQVDMWAPLAGLLPTDTLALWTAKLNERTQAERDRVFQAEIAPGIAEAMVQNLRFAYITDTGARLSVSLDATLVSRYAESVPLYVSLRPAGPLPNLAREDIVRFEVSYEGDDLPADARVIVHSGKVRYQSPHLTYLLFDEPRVLNDLHPGDPVVVPTPVTPREMAEPREEDRRLADRLVKHLNRSIEHYHQAIWATMDAQRRYMLLDGVIAPNADGRSVASVVENRVAGIVGNCLVMPLSPGNRLDPQIAPTPGDNGEEPVPVDLINLYATDPLPPTRISIPTRGVYAEAVMGDCCACETIDDTRFWRWGEEGGEAEALQPPAIAPVSTDSRDEGEPDLTPTPLPTPIVNIQAAPSLPDPFGLAAAFEVLKNPDLFTDVTGLEGSQKAALAAFSGSLDVASALSGEAAKLATQQEAARTADRTLAAITQAEGAGLLTADQAKALTEATLSRLVGQPDVVQSSQADQAASSQALDDVVDAAVQSGQGEITSSTPDQTVTVSFDGASPTVGAASTVVGVDYPTPPLLQQDLIVDKVVITGATTSFVVPPGSRDKAELLKLRPTNLKKRTVKAIGKAVIDHGLVVDDPTDTSKFLVPLNLRVAYPADPADANAIAGTGRCPVVIIVHGNHESWEPEFGPKTGTTTVIHPTTGLPVTCDVFDTATSVHNVPSFEGYAYLQEDLAKRGIVSVSVDTNFANRFRSLVETRSDMVLAALDHMRALDLDTASRYAGRLDLANVGLMGHSRGGDAVTQVVDKNLARPTATRFGIKAVCSLAPTDLTGSATSPVSRTQLSSGELDFYLVVWGTLDGDVSGLGGADDVTGNGFRHYERTGAPKAAVHLDRCEHNRFNTVWQDETKGEDDPTRDPFAGDDPGLPAKDRDLVRSGLDHRALAIEYIGGMFAWQLQGDTTARALLQGIAANGRGVPASVQWLFGDRIRLLDTLDSSTPDLPGATRTLVAGHRSELAALAALESTLEPGGDPVPVTIAAHVGGRTQVVEIDTAAAPPASDQVMTLTIPAAEKDWSTDVDTLTFRLGALYDITSQARIDAGPQPLAAITLVDTAGKPATVVIGPGLTTSSPARPAFHLVDYEQKLLSRPRNATLLRSETVRVRLDRFGGPAGIDLANVAQLIVKFDETNATRVLFDSFALVKE